MLEFILVSLVSSFGLTSYSAMRQVDIFRYHTAGKNTVHGINHNIDLGRIVIWLVLVLSKTFSALEDVWWAIVKFY